MCSLSLGMMELGMKTSPSEYVAIFATMTAYYESPPAATSDYAGFFGSSWLPTTWVGDYLERRLDGQFFIMPSQAIIDTPEYDAFKTKMIPYNMLPPFNFGGARRDAKQYTINKTIGGSAKFAMSVLEFVKKYPFAGYLYDATVMYATALTEHLLEGGDVTDGRRIMNKLFNSSFHSISGFDIYMDADGNVGGNYTVYAVQAARDWNYSHHVVPVAQFDHEFEVEMPSLSYFADPHDPSKKRAFMWFGGRVPPDEPPCGFRGDKCIRKRSTYIILGVMLSILLIALIASFVFYRRWRYEKEIEGLIWKISVQDVKFCNDPAEARLLGDASKLTIASRNSAEVQTMRQIIDAPQIGLAQFKGTFVVVTKVPDSKSKRVRDISRAMKIEMKNMRNFHHMNVNPFMGLILQQRGISIVREFCAKGSLYDLLLEVDIKLDSTFIASLVDDLLKGLIYLHDSELHVHGNLKSTNCLVTSRWVLQVSDFGLHELRDSHAPVDGDSKYESYLWTAPELLRLGAMLKPPKGTQKADVYSFSIIFHEILARRGPFNTATNLDHTCKDIVLELMKPTHGSMTLCRPTLEFLDLQDYIINVLCACWSDHAEKRPDFRSVRKQLKPLYVDMQKGNIMDHMITMMEKYQNNLEHLVEERTYELKVEKKLTDRLLHRMLPKTVADQLLSGGTVTPESFHSVTIYFSDIVNFTTLCSESTPMQVVEMLNALYKRFDALVQRFNVYKVETIGDAYMVVSGLPERCVDNAGQIASMALAILDDVRTFEIAHRPDKVLLVRIGIHTGSCVAGVVGETMPRYCLFGDSVNTASRMESTSEAMKIHCSPAAKQALDQLGGFVLESRGVITVKGKGKMETFFLERTVDPLVIPPVLDSPDEPLFGISHSPWKRQTSVRNKVGPLNGVVAYASQSRLRDSPSLHMLRNGSNTALPSPFPRLATREVSFKFPNTALHIPAILPPPQNCKRGGRRRPHVHVPVHRNGLLCHRLSVDPSVLSRATNRSTNGSGSKFNALVESEPLRKKSLSFPEKIQHLGLDYQAHPGGELDEDGDRLGPLHAASLLALAQYKRYVNEHTDRAGSKPRSRSGSNRSSVGSRDRLRDPRAIFEFGSDESVKSDTSAQLFESCSSLGAKHQGPPTAIVRPFLRPRSGSIARKRSLSAGDVDHLQLCETDCNCEPIEMLQSQPEEKVLDGIDDDCDDVDASSSSAGQISDVTLDNSYRTHPNDCSHTTPLLTGSPHTRSTENIIIDTNGVGLPAKKRKSAAFPILNLHPSLRQLTQKTKKKTRSSDDLTTADATATLSTPITMARRLKNFVTRTSPDTQKSSYDSVASPDAELSNVTDASIV